MIQQSNRCSMKKTAATISITNQWGDCLWEHPLLAVIGRDQLEYQSWRVKAIPRILRLSFINRTLSPVENRDLYLCECRFVIEAQQRCAALVRVVCHRAMPTTCRRSHSDAGRKRETPADASPIWRLATDFLAVLCRCAWNNHVGISNRFHFVNIEVFQKRIEYGIELIQHITCLIGGTHTRMWRVISLIWPRWSLPGNSRETNDIGKIHRDGIEVLGRSFAPVNQLFGHAGWQNLMK